MLQNSVKLSIPFESLVKSLNLLDFNEKYRDGSLLFESLRLKDGAIFGVERVKLS